MTIPCASCGSDTGIAEVDSPLAKAFTRMVLCDECQAPRLELAEKIEHEKRIAEFQQRVRDTLPRDLRLYRFSTSPAPAEARRAAEKWAREGGRLLLTGRVGRGKTGLAAAAVWARLAHIPIRWVNVPTLLTGLLADRGSEERQRSQKILAGKSSVCFDDIDKFKPSEWAASQLFASIDNAITSGRDIVVTTNKTPAEIGRFIGGDTGEAIASRLAQFDVVTVTGPDHRIKTKEAAA